MAALAVWAAHLHLGRVRVLEEVGREGKGRGGSEPQAREVVRVVRVEEVVRVVRVVRVEEVVRVVRW